MKSPCCSLHSHSSASRFHRGRQLRTRTRCTELERLQNNTTGGNNTANGQSVLYSDTTGSDNTANGYEALSNNTTGFRNTASGSQTLVATPLATTTRPA